MQQYIAVGASEMAPFLILWKAAESSGGTLRSRSRSNPPPDVLPDTQLVAVRISAARRRSLRPWWLPLCAATGLIIAMFTAYEANDVCAKLCVRVPRSEAPLSVVLIICLEPATRIRWKR